MSDDGNPHSFWTEGPKMLKEALKERRGLFDSLVRRLRGAKSESEKSSIEKELTDMMHEYNPSDEEIDQSLFLIR